MKQFQHIDVSRTQSLLADPTQEVRVVDIRDPQSFANGHIQGSIQLTNDNLREFLDETDEDQAVVVVCYHGISSQQAAQYLVEQGLNQVYSLDGGYQAWGQAQYAAG
ncbi:thiosulfate sulfurtransferase GlpE [Paraferrimonas sedimenticola]|uniref:Thiosulfate sulfurtransferase GlpE n=1 Tax=Paraferrimonas sedimenticola TaxID=375674 RepID=A0AA37VVB9_9GAMM|nr:thiosulfate sulfurtransferase GlpE [Paraferrimonas sedimenticola]GLP95981.1 thiosulfate sulfurtransferase GlpE [Paraferrimonas sedimenticola]